MLNIFKNTIKDAEVNLGPDSREVVSWPCNLMADKEKLKCMIMAFLVAFFFFKKTSIILKGK